MLGRFLSEGINIESQNLAASDVVGSFAASIRDLAQRADASQTGPPTRLNIVLTNGRLMLASRWKNSLFRREGVRDCEICGIPHIDHDANTDYRAIVIASEPISAESWQEIPDQRVIAVDADVRDQVFAM